MNEHSRVWHKMAVALMAPVVAEPVRQAQSSSPTVRPATIATGGIPDADRYQEFRQAAQGLGEGVATWCGQLIAEAEQGRDARALQQRRQSNPEAGATRPFGLAGAGP